MIFWLSAGFLGFATALISLVYFAVLVREFWRTREFVWISDGGQVQRIKGPLAYLCLLIGCPLCLTFFILFLGLGLQEWFEIQLPDWWPRLSGE